MPDSDRDSSPTDRTHDMTLRDLLNAESRLHIGEAVRIGVAAARELIRSQNEELFYRELQPENIFLEQVTLEPYFASTPSATEPGKQSPESRKNVFPYMSPEMMCGHQPDMVSNVWCLGVLLSEMIAGEPPFQQDHIGTDGEIEALPPDLQTLRPETPEKLAILIYRMLDTDRDLRIQSLETVQSELRAILDSMKESTETAAESGGKTTCGEMTTAPTTSLSFTTTPFVGRQDEMDRIKTMLAEPRNRLLTLVGPGGIGKSRLAFQVAQEMTTSFRDGVYFVPLNPVRSPEFIVLAVGHAIGFAFSGGREPRLQLMNYLRSKELLLILDDFDELVEGAGLITEILENAPHVKILVTSRERLNLRSEWVFEISGLNVPTELDEKNPLAYESVQLFHESAKRMQSDFALSADESPLVVQICQLLDGMPLAIELASAWMRVLPCRQIAREIERGLDVLSTTEHDVPERHRSIRAALDRSWKMLSEKDKAVLMRLSIFRGGFRGQSAKEIAGATLMMLAKFVDKSLVRRDAFGRIQIHELLRQYLEERLRVWPEELERIRKLHAGHFGMFLEEKWSQLRGEGQKAALEQIEAEIGNIHNGWEWSIENVRVENIGRYVGSLHLVYQMRGWFRQGDKVFLKAVTKIRASTESSDPRSEVIDGILARMIARRGVLKCLLGHYGEARELLEESVVVLRKSEMWQDSSLVLRTLGEVAMREGKYDEAQELQKQCLALSRQADDRFTETDVLADLGFVTFYLGKYDEARALFDESLAISRKLEFLPAVARALIGLGNIAYSIGNHSRAEQCYEEGLRISRGMGHRPAIASVLNSLGNAAYVLGDYQKARKLYEESLKMAQDIGADPGVARGLYLLGHVHCRLEEYEEAKKLLEESNAVFVRIGDRRQLAYGLVILGDILQALGDHSGARHVLVESLGIFRDLGARRGVVSSLSGLAEVALALADIQETAKLLTEGLRIAVEIDVTPIALSILLVWAKLFEAEGDKPRAAGILAYLSSHKACQAETRQGATTMLARLSSELSTEELNTAMALGKSRTLEEIVTEFTSRTPHLKLHP